MHNGRNITNEVSILSARDSTKSFSSGTSTELLSSESSLTGISFTSSNGTFGVSEKLDKACTSTDDILALLGSDTLVTLQNDSPVKSTDLVSPSPYPLVLEEQYNDQIGPAKSTELANIDEKSVKDIVMTSLKATHGKYSKPTEETPLYSKLICECCNVKKSPGEFMKKTVCQGTCKNEKQIQIQQLQRELQDKTESEDLLKRRCESLENKFNRTENKSDFWFNQCVKKEEKIKELLIREQNINSFNTELRQQIVSKSKIIKEKDAEIQRITKSKNETKALLQEVNMKLFKANEEAERLKMIVRQSLKEDKLHSKQLSVQPDERFERAASTFTKFELGRSTGTTPLEDIPSRQRNHFLDDTKINKKIRISDWVSEVIRSAKAELAREESLHNSIKKSSTDQKLPEQSVKKIRDNGTFNYPLRDNISSFKERLSKNVKTKRLEGYLSGFNKRPVALSSSDGKGSRLQTLATDDSSVTFDSSATFPDVFLTMFEYMDFSSIDNLVSPEPFDDLFFPWLCSKNATVKQMMRSPDPTPLTTKLYLNKEEHIDNKKNLEITTGEQKVRAEKPAIFLKRSKKTAAERKVKPSFGNKHLFLEGITKANQSVPSTETPPSNRPQHDHSDGLVDKINNVTSFSEQFTKVENDIEHIIPEEYAKKTSSVSSPRDQRCLVKKFLHFKLKDSKFFPSTRNMTAPPNCRGFIDSINVEIKPNTKQKQQRKDLANRELFKTQQPKESLNTQYSLKKLTLEEMSPQRKKRLPSEFTEDNSFCSFSSGLDQKIRTHKSFLGENGYNISEITKNAEDITKQWIGDSPKYIRNIENRDGFINGTAVESPTQPQGGSSDEAFSSINKQIITNTKGKAKLNILKSQPIVKRNLHKRENSPGTKRLPRNILSGHKGQQEKSERDVRIKMWRERNGWLGNKLKDKTNDKKNMEHGLDWKTRDTKVSNVSCDDYSRKKNIKVMHLYV